MREGDICFLAASCILSAITFDVEIEAQGSTEVLLIPARILSMLTKENIYLENFMYKETARRFSDVVEALQQLMFLSLTQRIVSFLLDEAAKNKASSIVHDTRRNCQNYWKCQRSSQPYFETACKTGLHIFK